MCGIFGIVNYGKDKRYMADLDHIKEMTANLLSISQDRGTDASGICVVTQTNKALLFKDHVPGRKLTTEAKYTSIMQELNYQTNFKFMIGHTRAKTKGDKQFNVNNHPIVAGRVIGVHNGMISNDDDLFKMNKELERSGQVDSEIIFRLLNHYMGTNYTIISALNKTASALTGSYSCAFFHLEHPNYLTLFAGAFANVCIQDFRKDKFMVFASTDHIITEAGKGTSIFSEPTDKLELQRDSGIRINVTNGKLYTFPLNRSTSTNSMSCGFPAHPNPYMAL